MANVTINSEAILVKCLKSQGIQRQIQRALAEKVEVAKEELLHEFEESPVTQEILEGPDAPSSKVLPSGYGNLFSFLGFKEGTDPITPVRELIEKIGLTGRPEVRSRSWIFKIRIPSEDDIEKASPMEWESGRSWISAVTRGLSGFSHYLNSLRRRLGRSTGGIETKTAVRPGGEYFAGTPYLIGMLGRFKRRFTR
jgi:hypothetical protein